MNVISVFLTGALNLYLPFRCVTMYSYDKSKDAIDERIVQLKVILNGIASPNNKLVICTVEPIREEARSFDGRASPLTKFLDPVDREGEKFTLLLHCNRSEHRLHTLLHLHETTVYQRVRSRGSDDGPR
jgi:hypothetical protein